jgi:hypothetical protein
MIPSLIYILCTLTSVGCAVLLWRGYRKTRQRLLWWSALSFAGLAVSNVFLFLDLTVFPDIDFVPLRNVTTLVAIIVLLYGLIFESH